MMMMTTRSSSLPTHIQNRLTELTTYPTTYHIPPTAFALAADGLQRQQLPTTYHLPPTAFLTHLHGHHAVCAQADPLASDGLQRQQEAGRLEGARGTAANSKRREGVRSKSHRRSSQRNQQTGPRDGRIGVKGGPCQPPLSFIGLDDAVLLLPGILTCCDRTLVRAVVLNLSDCCDRW